MKLAIAQMNPVVGDYEGNYRKILSWIQKAESQGSDLVIFPELALSGYPVWDLANNPAFVETGWAWVRKLAHATRIFKIGIILGFIDYSQTQSRRSRNALLFLHGGQQKALYHKQLLPTYDVFLEDLFFESGARSCSFTFKGQKLGVTICEDIWDDGYKVKPVRELAKQSVDLIINISASPYYRGVFQKREAVVRRHTLKNRIPMLYVNQVGAQDDLIFDGQSFLMNAAGEIVFKAPAFKEDLYLYPKEPAEVHQPSLFVKQNPDFAQEMYQALVLGVRDYCKKNGFTKAILGLSGGVDSALTAAVACDALGPQAVKGITMPSPYSTPGSWKDSEELARRLGMVFETHPIRKQYEQLVKTYQAYQNLEKDSRGKITLAMENLQARLRGLELMYFSNDEGRLLLSTGNKSELAMGYCTLYGDMCGGLAVLGDVYKTDVYRLSKYRNTLSPVIPEPILTKAPSAELRPDQKDQDSLPPYDLLDEMLRYYIEKQMSAEEIYQKLKNRKVSKAVIQDVIRRVDHNEYKRRQTPPILRVTEKAWFGRRMPITNRFRP